MQPIKLVIFDMGNTLLNFHAGTHTDEEKDALGIHYMQTFIKNHYAVEIPISTLQSTFLDKWYGDFYLRDQLIELDVCQYLGPVLAAYGLTISRNEAIALMNEFYKAYREEVVMSQGVKPLLEFLHLQGIKIAVASNCILFDEIYESIFEMLGIAKYIDYFVFSYSRQIRKPDSRIFIEILDHFNVPRREVMMVGDSWQADIEPAKALGLQTIWINRKQETTTKEASELTVNSFEAATEVLMAICSTDNHKTRTFKE